MNEAPVSCLPNASKMSKAKKVIEEARDTHNPEVDLVDKGVSSFDELPGLRTYHKQALIILDLPKFGH